MTAIALNAGFAPARTVRAAASPRPLLTGAVRLARGFRLGMAIEAATAVLALGFSTLVVAAFW